jgi:hypothetical protein
MIYSRNIQKPALRYGHKPQIHDMFPLILPSDKYIFVKDVKRTVYIHCGLVIATALHFANAWYFLSIQAALARLGAACPDWNETVNWSSSRHVIGEIYAIATHPIFDVLASFFRNTRSASVGLFIFPLSSTRGTQSASAHVAGLTRWSQNGF